MLLLFSLLLLLQEGAVLFALSLAHKVNNAGENKKSEEKYSAVVILHHQKIDHAEHAQYSAAKPEALQKNKSGVLCFRVHHRLLFSGLLLLVLSRIS